MLTARDLRDDLAREFGSFGEALPACADSESGELLIVGPGRSVWDDLERASMRWDIMCVNDIGMHLPRRIKHWYSNHADCLPYWKICRDFHYGSVIGQDSFAMHSCFGGALLRLSPEINNVMRWPWPGHASSGLNACYTGLGLGYERVILAGIPYDDTGHYYDPQKGHQVWLSGTEWLDFGIDGFRRLLARANDEIFQGRVKSFSGVTREIFGEP